MIDNTFNSFRACEHSRLNPVDNTQQDMVSKDQWCYTDPRSLDLILSP